MGDLMDVVDELEKWETGKGVLLMGNGGNFCSGGDLDLARGTSNPDDGFRMFSLMDNILSRFQTLPLISVALIEGCGEICLIWFFNLKFRGFGGRCGVVNRL